MIDDLDNMRVGERYFVNRLAAAERLQSNITRLICGERKSMENVSKFVMKIS